MATTIIHDVTHDPSIHPSTISAVEALVPTPGGPAHARGSLIVDPLPLEPLQKPPADFVPPTKRTRGRGPTRDQIDTTGQVAEELAGALAAYAATFGEKAIPATELIASLRLAHGWSDKAHRAGQFSLYCDIQAERSWREAAGHMKKLRLGFDYAASCDPAVRERFRACARFFELAAAISKRAVETRKALAVGPDPKAAEIKAQKAADRLERARRRELNAARAAAKAKSNLDRLRALEKVNAEYGRAPHEGPMPAPASGK